MRRGKWEKGVEEFGELVKQYSGDNLGYNNLAICYQGLHNKPKAIEELQRSLEILPNNQAVRMNLAILTSYVEDFPTAERELRTVLQLRPSFENAYVSLAYTQVGQAPLAEAIKAYEHLEKISHYRPNFDSPTLA